MTQGGKWDRRYTDVIQNIGAAVISLGATQLIALPLLSRSLTPVDYGVMLVLVGVMNATGVAVGNPLNNTRLIRNREYDDAGLQGDFNLIARRGGAAVFLIVLFLAVMVARNEPWFSWVTVAATGYLVFARAYYTVAFRISLNFAHIFRSSVAGAVGTLLGLIINELIAFWPAVFFFAELAQFVYLTKYSFAWREVASQTRLWPGTRAKFYVLASAGFVSALMPYLDRFLIYPFLSARDVSLFVVATYLGKVVGGIGVPIASVLLSHDVRLKTGTRVLLWKRASAVLILCVFLYFVIVTVDSYVLTLLFPTLVRDSEPYLALATAATLVGVMGTLMNPSVLRFAPLRYQLHINVWYLVVIVGLGLAGSHFAGLQGFCFGLLIANGSKLVLMLCVAHRHFGTD